MATTKPTPISTDIPSVDSEWTFEDNGVLKTYDGYAVERFIRSQLKSCAGFGIIPTAKQTDGFYHVWCFHDRKAYNDYLTDPLTNADLLLFDMAIPIVEEQGGVSDIVTLTRNSPASIVTNNPEASVTVSYLWQQFNPVTQTTTDQDEDAEILVSCRTQNANGTWSAWDLGKEFTVNIQSGQTKTIDISSILTSDATYQVRFIATGEISGVTASPVTVIVVYSNVNVTYDGSIATPYQGSSIQLPFRISGNVQKQLRLKINGYTKNYTLGTTTYTDNTYAAVATQSEFALVRGAVKAEVWIAFGESYAAETEHKTFQFIYRPEGDTVTTPILAVTDVVSAFENWTRATIFRYAIFNPSASESFLRITLQDADTGQIYITREQMCANGEAYDFNENFAMEYEGDDPPSVIHAQASFVNASSVTYGNSLSFTVDNSENFAPTRGATLVISPERKQILVDGVEYQLSDLLQNPEDTNSGWKTNTETDSTGAQVEVPILGIAAGNRLVIPYELFESNTGHINGGVEGSITAEFDFKSKNIVGDSPIIDASAPFNSRYTGLRFYPTRGACLSCANFTEEICDVRYLEETREHIGLNIIRNLRGEGLNLVRIFVNGKSNRSYMYDDDDSFVPIGSSGAQNIIIGSDEADIDLYGSRVYKGLQLGATQIQNDYMAGMPTIADKKNYKRFNSIYNGSEISYDQCNAMGLNTILRRIPAGGHYPSRENQDKQKNVQIDVKIFTERGNPESLDMKHSGTFTGMTTKGQGTSAMGYYWWNTADGFEDDVEITEAEYDGSNGAHYTKDGKYYKKVSYFNSLDGTSQVFASKYEIEDGRSGITKLVGKCNYASPQQSHKLGAVWSCDELWQRLVNNGSDGRPILKDTHVACYEKPFLAFYQIGNGNPVFCGFQTWGSGKGDKKTFGYDKTKSPGYICVSGADNGAIAALFQMPWVVNQNAQGAWEGNIYAKSVTINTGDVKNGYCYKSGSSDNLAFEVEIGSTYDGGETDKGKLRIKDEAKGEAETSLFTNFAGFANFIFSSSPLLKPYAGTEAQLIADSANLSQDHQYWLFNSDSDRYNVYYYNPATGLYEKIVKVATAWGSNGRASAYGSPKLTEQLAGQVITIDTVSGTQSMTLEDAFQTLGTADMNVVNDCFKKARVAYFKQHATAYLDVVDAIFHICYIQVVAGTDNRAKNTYPFIDPSVDLLVRWKLDDLDTILPTDNQGRQTKPYYVLPHTVDANNNYYWNGVNNVVWTLIEQAYPERMRNMTRDMFVAMSEIAGSVDNYFQERFWWVQEYFPAVAYNETMRVLYEVAQVKVNNGQLDVSQAPITQAIGDQLECEKQFMLQRLPMLMSWCEYETGDDGTLSFRSVNDRNGYSPRYDLTYTAYQYIYPKLSVGGNMATLYAMKDGEWVDQGGEPYLCAPGETVRLVVARSDNNTQFTLRWTHYAKSIGNLGNLPCADDGTVSVSGRRLRRLDCYAEDGQLIEFHPLGINIAGCRNLESVDFTGAESFSGTFSADLPRLVSLKLSGTAYTKVNLPKTSTLVSAEIPGSVYDITVSGQPNLEQLVLDGLTNLRTLTIEGKHKIQAMTQSIIMLAYSQATALNSVKVEGVNWSGFPIETMMWLQGMGAILTGVIGIDGNLTLAHKLLLVNSYGDIDNYANALYLDYYKHSINSIVVNGPFYISETGYYQYSITCTPSKANDVVIQDGKMLLEWSIEDAGKTYADFTDPVNGVLGVIRLDDSGADQRYTATCTLTKINGTVKSAEFQIGFYNRIPKIGDFAYADGTFDDEYRPEKTFVGIVYKIDEMWQGEGDSAPTVFTGYDKPSQSIKDSKELVGYQVLIDAKSDMLYKSTDNFLNSSSAVWGLCDLANSSGHGEIASEITAATGITSLWDIPGISNAGQIGLSGGTQNDQPLQSNYIDLNEEDGFKDYSSVWGAVSDWNGKHNTKAIVNHANQLITGYLFTDENVSVNTFYIDDEDVGHEFADLPFSVEELSNAMEVLYKANNNMGKYQQFLYPAAYGCYLYEPTVKENETLDVQYKRTNWFLPSCGEAFRQYSFFAMSRTGGMGVDSYYVGEYTSPAKSVIDNMITTALNSEEPNEIKDNVSPSHITYNDYTALEMAAINRYFHNLKESQKPIYSMVIWRTVVNNNSTPFAQRNIAPYKTSSEQDFRRSQTVAFGGHLTVNDWPKCYGAYVRPSVAYRFYL